MTALLTNLKIHRIQADDIDSVVNGKVLYSPAKSLWISFMLVAALVGGFLTFSWSAFVIF